MRSAILSPTLLAFTSAFLFAVSVQFQNLGLRYADSRTGTLIQILAATALYWLLTPWFLLSTYWFTSAVLVFAAIGLFRPFLSANLALAGVRHLGPTLATTLASTAPLFAALFAVILLGESLSPPVLTGTVVIVLAITLLTRRPGQSNTAWPLWALLLPLGAAAFRALGHAFTKYGLETVAEPLFAGLVGYTVSLLIAGTTSIASARRRVLRIHWHPGLLWFYIGGTINGIAIWSLNTALGMGSVVTVVPIVSLSPIFSFFLGLLVFRRETFTARIVISILLVVPGVILVSMAA